VSVKDICLREVTNVRSLLLLPACIVFNSQKLYLAHVPAQVGKVGVAQDDFKGRTASMTIFHVPFPVAQGVLQYKV
jgi:hypothetical protein